MADGLRWSGQFTWDGATGDVQAECVANDDPEGYGCVFDDAFGFPVCTARVSYPRRGYNTMFGWVQLVRSTDNGSRGAAFEPDPLDLFADAKSPYCWYGTEPTLFDAPSRGERSPMEWVAHSYLASTPIRELLAGGPRRVTPVLGFRWGFDIDAGGAVQLREIARIGQAEWNVVLPVLRAAYPAPVWTFADQGRFD